VKPRYKELLDRAVEALAGAIEIYNKPNILYREEIFVILALNAWELLLKAKWLHEHGNKMQSLFINIASRGGRPRYKKTKSGVPLTHGVEYLARKLVEERKLDPKVTKNIEALTELRNAAVHFYLNRRNPLLTESILELGLASIKNFISATLEWFNIDLSKIQTPILPISIDPIPETAVLKLNTKETMFLEYLSRLRSDDDPAGPYVVAVNVEIRFTRSKSSAALPVRITQDPNATAVHLTEEQIRERYPFDYKQLTEKCKSRYVDFKVNKKYHNLRKQIENDRRYAYVRRLDPDNPNSTKKVFYSSNIFTFFDRHYLRGNE